MISVLKNLRIRYPHISPNDLNIDNFRFFLVKNKSTKDNKTKVKVNIGIDNVDIKLFRINLNPNILFGNIF